jgi:hypothetical protein
MRRFAVIGAFVALAAICAAQGRYRRIRAIGEFSNVRTTGEHAYGYSVQLWRVDNSVDGLLMIYAREAGDPPTAMLDGVSFKPRTGALSFTVKMTTGCDVLPGLKLKPARESFEFSGVLIDDILKGKISRRDLDRSESSPTVQEVELARRPDAALLQAGSYSEWKDKAEEMARTRELQCKGTLGERKKGE